MGNGAIIMNMELLNFYKKTSAYTELGNYKDFAKSLPNDIKTLCLLQRRQIIHPITVIEALNGKNDFHINRLRLVEPDVGHFRVSLVVAPPNLFQKIKTSGPGKVVS